MRTPECKSPRTSAVRAGEDLFMVIEELDPETKLKLLSGFFKSIEKNSEQIQKEFKLVKERYDNPLKDVTPIPVITPKDVTSN